jgi:peptide/nickel transport system ATP-binding protein
VRDRCRTERPALRDLGPGRRAACHFADELRLDGIADAAPPRSAAVERRFALLAAATRADGAEQETDPSKEMTQ